MHNQEINIKNRDYYFDNLVKAKKLETFIRISKFILLDMFTVSQ